MPRLPLLSSHHALVPMLAFAGLLQADLPANFVEKALATKTNLTEPTSMAFSDDGRIFVSERGGKIRLVSGDSAGVIYQINTTINREQGLLKIQVHPNFAAKPWLYAYYMTADYDHHNVSRLVLDKTSHVVSIDTIIKLPQLENQGRHNGSGLVFGKDGFLYVSRGQDELSGAANPAALWTSVKGKILRFTEDGKPAPGNPHYNTAGASDGEKSIWARGFRNPWTLSYDPYSGHIYEGDVGDGTEEVNDVTAPDPAKDYWYGYGVGGGDGVGAGGGKATDPIYFHATGGKGECAVVAEAPYNAAQSPSTWPAEWKNKLYIADYCAGTIRAVPLTPAATATDIQNSPSSVMFYDVSKTKVGLYIGPDGNMYYANYGTNTKIYQISYNGPSTAVASQARLQVRNSLVRAGAAADLNLELDGSFSLKDASSARLEILDPKGRTVFAAPMALDGVRLSAHGFKAPASGLYLCRLTWDEQGSHRQAQGHLLAMP